MFQPSDPGDDLPCKVQIGFLFKRTCGRMNRIGCQYCKGQSISKRTNTWDQGYDPYYTNRSWYGGYGNYSSGYWGNDYYNNYHDFTDADSRSVGSERDTDYRQDMGS